MTVAKIMNLLVTAATLLVLILAVATQWEYFQSKPQKPTSSRNHQYRHAAYNSRNDPEFQKQAAANREIFKNPPESARSSTSNSNSRRRSLQSLEQIQTASSIQADFTFNVLVVLIQWTNHASRPLIEPSAIEELWNGVGVGDNYLGGSISNWTAVNSHGKWKAHATVSDWIMSDNTEQYYAAGNAALPGSSVDFNDAVKHAMQQLDATGTIDFAQFDHDNDGFMDSVVVMHSGYDAANNRNDCNDPSVTAADQIHSIQRSGHSIGWFSSNSFRAVGNYAVDSAYIGNCDFTINRIGVTIHEFMHTLGLPDLYDLGGSPEPDSGFLGGLGSFDIMSNPFGAQLKPKNPGHLSPWSKKELNWITPTEITSNGVFECRASEVYEDYYIISEPYPDGEYLMIENRQPILFDEKLWNPGGIVIYHVDDNVQIQDVTGYPGQAGWPQNGNHYKVAVLQADGQYDLERGNNNGHIDDFWSYAHSLEPNDGGFDFPNTDAYSGGNVFSTGITINNFQEVTPGVWSFQVSGLSSNPPPTPQPTRRPTPQPTPAPVSPPSPAPVIPPTPLPTRRPTPAPVPAPTTKSPTPAPNPLPTTNAPVQAPTKQPTPAPVTTSPPVAAPVVTPTTSAPSKAPTGGGGEPTPTEPPVGGGTATDSPVENPPNESPVLPPNEAPTADLTPSPVGGGGGGGGDSPVASPTNEGPSEPTSLEEEGSGNAGVAIGITGGVVALAAGVGYLYYKTPLFRSDQRVPTTEEEANDASAPPGEDTNLSGTVV